MDENSLKIDNQICFPFYAVTRLIVRAYQPHLEKLGITYPQYLVLMVLWEKDNLPVKIISKKLLLDTNTLTPLLKRMEKNGLIARKRSEKDERSVIISLETKGTDLKKEALKIPEQMLALYKNSDVSIDEMLQLKQTISKMLAVLDKK